MAERRQPGVAHQEIQAHREDGVDEHMSQHLGRVRRDEPHQRQAGREQEHDDDLPRHTRPIRPVGRSASTMTIGTMMVKSESCGNQAVPKFSTSPTSRLARKAPFTLPRPPTVTTTKARSATSKSAPGKRPSSGPPSTPPSAASAAPMPNTTVKTSGMLMPMPRTISSSSIPARMIAPKRVRSRNNQSRNALA